jgi:ABC-2 type transport system permease protein
MVQEIQAINFPSFVDVRADGMNTENGLMAGLASVTMPWSSPVVLDETKNANRETSVLMHSTPGSWTTTNLALAPDFDTYPDTGYPVEGTPAEQPLAVSVQGVFESFFKDKPSPLAPAEGEDPAAATPAGAIPATIPESPDTARLVVIGSAEMADDVVMQVLGQMIGDQAFNNVQFVQNAVDWSVEDADLLAIRGRGAGVRLLDPLTEEQQTGWEVGKSVVALLRVLGVGGYFLLRCRNERPMELEAES